MTIEVTDLLEELARVSIIKVQICIKPFVGIFPVGPKISSEAGFGYFICRAEGVVWVSRLASCFPGFVSPVGTSLG